MDRPAMHLLDATLPTAAANVALDEALLLDAEERSGPGLLRTWELGHFAVVLGASGRLAEDVLVEACRLDGVEVARRSSGGGTVVIGPGALNVSVILPIDAAPELKNVDEAQRFILGRTAEAIRSFGPEVELRGSGDLTLGLRKFSGSAQRRLRRYLLVHASLLYDFPLDRIDRYTRQPRKRPDYRGDRPHSEFVANLPLPRDRLVEALRLAWLPGGRPDGEATIPENILGPLLATKFQEIGWIERL